MTDSTKEIRIRVGHYWTRIDEKNVEWTLYVEGGDDAISSVEFQLHETFTPPSVTITKPPFQIKRVGWGTFDVRVKVRTIDEKEHCFVHRLLFAFDKKNVSSDHKISVSRKKSTITKDTYPADPQVDALLDIIQKDAVRPFTGRRMNDVEDDVSRQEMHGRLGEHVGAKWEAPRLVTFCEEEARPGYESKMAHEYCEEPRVLREKVKALSELIRKSKTCTAYTGAGISTASGIDDYASKAKGSIAMKRKKVSGFDAMPTLAHRVLASLHRAGHLKHWVQQNHDGLPQKAGFPPEHLNEVHGAWYDPSNPVVPMSGSLRGDLVDWMVEWEQKADLCLAMGTSLCGMNADRMVVTPANKMSKEKAYGSVIIGLQRTQYDEISVLRIYAKIDDVMALLAKEMKLHVRKQSTYEPVVTKAAVVRRDVFRVPYDSTGKLTKDKSRWQNWDLRVGQEVRVTAGPGKNYVGVVVGQRKDGHYRVKLPLQREGHPSQGKQWSVYLLGSW